MEGTADDSDEIMATPDDEVKEEKNTQHCMHLPYLESMLPVEAKLPISAATNQTNAAFLKDNVWEKTQSNFVIYTIPKI